MIIWAPVFHFYQPRRQFPAVLKALKDAATDLLAEVHQSDEHLEGKR